MTNLVTVCCDCSCEKEKSLVRSFLSSVVHSQSVDCSITVAQCGGGQWRRTLFFFLCRTIHYTASVVQFQSVEAPPWQAMAALSLFRPKLCSSAIPSFFFLSLLSLPTTPLDGGVQLDKSLQNALAPLLNARDVQAPRSQRRGGQGGGMRY